jgi:CheY-like chemotaxis protein
MTTTILARKTDPSPESAQRVSHPDRPKLRVVRRMEERTEAGASLVLWIEDDVEFVRDLLRLWSPPWRVVHAVSGAEAVQHLAAAQREDEARPDLILLDLFLPHALADTDEGEGLEILRHVRDRLGWSIPVVVLTRETSSGMRRRAKARGASAFVPKPVDVGVLDRVVTGLLQQGQGHPGNNDAPASGDDP